MTKSGILVILKGLEPQEKRSLSNALAAAVETSLLPTSCEPQALSSRWVCATNGVISTSAQTGACLHPLSHERLERGDVDSLAARVRAHEPEDGELRGDGRVEDLRLHRVEVRKGEDALKGGLAERRERQRAQRQQRRVGGRRVGQRKVAERDGHNSLAAEPPIRDEAHEVLRGQRLEQRDGEGDVLRLVALLLVERPELFVVDVLGLGVLHPQPPVLHAAV
eukprot:6182325-Pleurochrysis_carterae.AAC.3